MVTLPTLSLPADLTREQLHASYVGRDNLMRFQEWHQEAEPWVQAWEKTGATPIVMTQPEFKSFMEAQVAKWAEVIKTNRIAPIN